MTLRPKKAYAIVKKEKGSIDPLQIYNDNDVTVYDDEIIVRVIISEDGK